MMAPPDEHQDDGRQHCSNTPLPLSINRLIAVHPRERLLVHPLRWSDRQLDLLGCRIHFCDAGSHESAEDESPVPDRLARLLARRLNRRLSWWRLTDTILKLLLPLGGAVSIEHGRAAHLYFDRRSCASIKYSRMSVAIPGPTFETVAFACFDNGETVIHRELLFRPPENRLGVMDLPGLHRLHALLKRHTPADPQKDPYLVALVIALAQQKQRRAAQPLPPSSSFTVRLLFAGQERPTPFNLYIAHVRACFLDRLDFPSQDPPVNSGLDIYHWRIAAEPFETLAQRLARALRFDCCGETYDVENSSDSRERLGQKRKRDVDLNNSISTPKR